MAEVQERDPKRGGPQPPFSKQQQEHPGSEEAMRPQPDYGEQSYRGSGRLTGKAALITGGDSGIGRAVALAFAREGADVLISYLNEEEDAQETERVVREAGRKAVRAAGDIRDEAQVIAAIDKTVAEFGGIDICVNNASAISLTDSQGTDMKRFDLMMQINLRGTFVVTRACLPHLRESDHAHVLTLSPPIDAVPRWVANNAAYTVSKMGMSMLTLGLAQDEPSISANCLWPRTLIATAAVQNLLGGDEAMAKARTPAIVADANGQALTSVYSSGSSARRRRGPGRSRG